MYYLSSTESKIFEAPRQIEVINEIKKDGRTYLLIKLQTPLIGQYLGMGGDDVEYLFLLSRYRDKDLSILKKLPTDVFILLPPAVSDISKYTENDVEKFEQLAWGTLYDNLKDAKLHRI